MIFNECPRDDWVVEGDRGGIQPGHAGRPGGTSYADYVARVAAITRLAHDEASPSKASLASFRVASAGGRATAGGHSTDPAAAAEFVAATGIDLLAVSVGNVHIRTRGESGLDLGCWRRFTDACRCHWSYTAGRESAAESLKERRSRWAWPRSISAPI